MKLQIEVCKDSFKKYVNKLKAIDDSLSGETRDYCIEDIVEEMNDEGFSIKEIYEFLIENYDDHYIPTILQDLYEKGERDDYFQLYPFFKPDLLCYTNKIKEILNKEKKREHLERIVEDMAIYYSLEDIYDFLVVIEERYSFFYIGNLLFHLYQKGFY